MITTCVMMADRPGETFARPGDAACGRPVPADRQQSGPWMCDPCHARSLARTDGTSSYVPMVADVYRVMNDYDVAQEDAVRILAPGAALAAQRWSKTGELTCAECGQVFAGRTGQPGPRYCDGVCRARAWRKRQRGL